MRLSFIAAGLLIASLAWSQQSLPVTTVPVPNEAPTKAGSYDWMARHNQVLERLGQGNVDLLMIGDSITHGWDAELWAQYYAPRNAVNMGFGWDGTQHVLWRLKNGAIKDLNPKVAVVLIGVNNIVSESPADVAAGVEAVVKTLREGLPYTKILLLGVFPHKETATDPMRGKIRDLNSRLQLIGGRRMVTFLDLGDRFVDGDGHLTPEIMPDYLHLSKEGYRIWAEAMEPTLSKLMGEPKK